MKLTINTEEYDNTTLSQKIDAFYNCCGDIYREIEYIGRDYDNNVNMVRGIGFIDNNRIRVILRYHPIYDHKKHSVDDLLSGDVIINETFGQINFGNSMFLEKYLYSREFEVDVEKYINSILAIDPTLNVM